MGRANGSAGFPICMPFSTEALFIRANGAGPVPEECDSHAEDNEDSRAARDDCWSQTLQWKMVGSSLENAGTLGGGGMRRTQVYPVHASTAQRLDIKTPPASGYQGLP